MEYKTIDLCAGIGGIRRGFELTGKFKNVLSAEIDKYACVTYEHLYGENPKNDLTSEEFKEKVANTEYDILLAGFPCQTFSRAGLQMGFRDTTKGTIFFSIADIISRTQPKAVFLENVENLISHDGGRTIQTIVNILENELDYRIIGVTLDENGEYAYTRKSFIRNSKNFGLPQNRPRAYIMAFSKKQYGAAIKMLNEDLPESGTNFIARDLTDILDPIVDDEFYMAQGYLDTLKKHKVREKAKGHGFGYMVVNEPGIEHPIASTILATGGSGKERNLIYQPKTGVAGKMVGLKKTPLNNEGIRVMTPTEWGRLQGFIGYAFVDKNGIDNFSFPEKTTKAQQYKQFGNSVTIPVIESMAIFMLSCFEKMSDGQKDVVIRMAEGREYFTKRDVIECLGMISVNQAGYLIKKLIEEGKIRLINRGRYSKYSIIRVND